VPTQPKRMLHRLLNRGWHHEISLLELVSYWRWRLVLAWAGATKRDDGHVPALEREIAQLEAQKQVDVNQLAEAALLHIRLQVLEDAWAQ
jgi:hypothetical protein